ncbi:ankyrin repeat-containing domain protein [Tuber brumale]|nr:ankyrin repeat-containing domain protein [Tuber brumale]
MSYISFTNLPNELLLEICTSPMLEIPDIASVLRTNHFLRRLLKPALRSEMFKRRCSKYCRKALYHAAERQERSTVESLLGDAILDIIEDGGTLLNGAVSSLSEEGLTTLLACGVDPNTVDERGRTSLICATSGRRLGAIRALLADVRVDVNCPWIFGDFGSLHLAVWNGYSDVVRLLLECPGIAVNQANNHPPASLAQPSERDQEILYMVMSDEVEGLSVPGGGGWAPLHGAVYLADPTILAILLGDERVDVNILSGTGYTPLRMSVGSVEMLPICMLLAHPKIQVHLEDGTILHFAAVSAEESTIELLLNTRNIGLNATNKNGKTALHLAAYHGRVGVVELLLGCRGLEIGKLDAGGRSARDCAIPKYPEIARALTIGEIARRKRMEYLDLAITSGEGRNRESTGARFEPLFNFYAIE